MKKPIDFQKLKAIMSDPVAAEKLFSNKILGGLFTQTVQDIQLGDDQIKCNYVVSQKNRLKVSFAKTPEGATDIKVGLNWGWTYFILFIISMKFLLQVKY
jgi:hypothetical protein